MKAPTAPPGDGGGVGRVKGFVGRLLPWPAFYELTSRRAMSSLMTLPTSSVEALALVPQAPRSASAAPSSRPHSARGLHFRSIPHGDVLLLCPCSPASVRSGTQPPADVSDHMGAICGDRE